MPDTPEITWRGCEDIIPKKESDCILSQADKDHNFAYCCFESLAGLINICTLETEESFKDEMETSEFFGYKDETIFICNDKVGKSIFINLSMMFFVLIILNI